MTISDAIMILAVLAGPVLAVQVQKKLDSWKEAKQRKLAIFRALMSTRVTPLSPSHVEALNMIDLEFSSKRPKEKRVIECWNAYLDHLNTPQPKLEEPAWQVRGEQWTQKSFELLADLLKEMSIVLGYDFDKTRIRKSVYRPQAHANIETELAAIRRFVVELFLGTKHLPVGIVPEKNASEAEREKTAVS